MAYKGEFDTVQINDDTYKVGFPKLNLDIECDHKYEVTGKTGHEYAVAVPDGQVLVKKINGQTRRKSLNLIDGVSFNHTTGQFGSAYVFSKGDLINGKQYTLNFRTKNTGAHLYVNEVLFSWKDFFCDGNGYSMVFTCQNSSNMILFKNAVDNTGKLNSDTIYNIQVLEGDYTNKELPAYQEYDNTLVSANCNFRSTGRNLLKPPTDLDQWANGAHAICNGDTFVFNGTPTSEEAYLYLKKMSLPKGTYRLTYFLTDGEDKISQLYVQKEATNAWFGNTGTTINITNEAPFWIIAQIKHPNTALNFSVKISLTYGEIAPTEYEPYEESSMLVNKDLGEFDYVDNQSHLLINQTSSVITCDGSSDEYWGAVDSQAGATSKLYKWAPFTSDQVEANKGVSNMYGEANESIWLNDEKCFGISTGENAVFIRVPKEECPDVNLFRTWLSSHNFQFVYKKTTPTTEPMQLEAGYQVWNGGLQIQETWTLPYILEKEYAISLSSQVLANTSLISSLPSYEDVTAKVEDTTLIL